MAYCPECMTEYESWSKECIDCHVPLNAGSPPVAALAQNKDDDRNSLDLVVVRTFTGAAASLNAELAKNILDAEGIPGVLLGENAARIFPLHTTVLLQVERKDAERAEEIMCEYFDDLPESSPEDELAND